LRLFAQITASFFCKKLIITFVHEKNAIFFAENWQKSQEIVIITSTPGPYLILNDQGQHGPVPLGEALGDDPGHAVVGKPYNASVSGCDHSVIRGRMSNLFSVQD
jgi:hypothetical protein